MISFNKYLKLKYGRQLLKTQKPANNLVKI